MPFAWIALRLLRDSKDLDRKVVYNVDSALGTLFARRQSTPMCRRPQALKKKKLLSYTNEANRNLVAYLRKMKGQGSSELRWPMAQCVWQSVTL